MGEFLGIFQMKFLKNTSAVGVYGMFADKQFIGDLLAILAYH